jgi:hypothetical protein
MPVFFNCFGASFEACMYSNVLTYRTGEHRVSKWVEDTGSPRTVNAVRVE